LDVLPNGHRAQNVKEDEGAVCVVIPRQVAVRQPLDPRYRGERQLGHHPSVKDRIKHSKERSEGEAYGQHGLHFNEGKVSIVVFQLLLFPINFLAVLLVKGIRVGVLDFLDYIERTNPDNNLGTESYEKGLSDDVTFL